MHRIGITLLFLSLGGCVFVPVQPQPGKAASETVVVCHKQKKTLELPREAAQAHIDHGDRYGPC